jgi:hypothetical protein
MLGVGSSRYVGRISSSLEREGRAKKGHIPAEVEVETESSTPYFSLVN